MTVRTVTLSPGFDHEVVVDHIEPGGVGTVLRWQTHAAGKGLNVARFLRALQVETVAYALLGVEDQLPFETAAARDDVRVMGVGIPGRIRNNLTLHVGSAAARSGHAAGPRPSDVSEESVARLFSRLLDEAEPGDVVTFNGSIPTGFRDEVWADVAPALVDRGVVLLADTQGASLVRLLSTGAVRAATPNASEATVLLPEDVTGDADPIAGASSAVRRMSELGVDEPIVSLGAGGVLRLRDGVIVQSRCPVGAPRVEVGAGDAFLAGYAAAVAGGDYSHIPPVDLGLAVAAAHVAGIGSDELRDAAMGRLASIVHQVLSWTARVDEMTSHKVRRERR